MRIPNRLALAVALLLEACGPRVGAVAEKDIGQLLQGVRIVELGEESHGDGAAFEAKVRLIKILHESYGFDILAWESGMLDCELWNNQPDPQEGARRAIFQIWSNSRQVQPVFDYMASTRNTARPLRLTGFDIQSMTSRPPTATGDAQLDARARQNYQAQEFRPKDSLRDYRDVHMGENLLWLAMQRYPKKKIVVWAANFHVARHVEENYRTMTDVVRATLGPAIYSIGFTAHHGRATAITLGTAAPDSLEGRLHTAGIDNAIVSVNGWRPLVAWPLLYQPKRRNWVDHFDAIYFNDEMTPSVK